MTQEELDRKIWTQALTAAALLAGPLTVQALWMPGGWLGTLVGAVPLVAVFRLLGFRPVPPAAFVVQPDRLVAPAPARFRAVTTALAVAFWAVLPIAFREGVVTGWLMAAGAVLLTAIAVATWRWTVELTPDLLIVRRWFWPARKTWWQRVYPGTVVRHPARLGVDAAFLAEAVERHRAEAVERYHAEASADDAPGRPGRG